ncbi:tRNA (adenosine(37)-N6)-threonylcarbamoyltransferase complex dimerization subunit type 1 TsaB [Brevibacillus sp. SYP-B805]|uniref:tRNA (adenosine(37)-N6)-threonylcarbamoyltransferase complex dimerization subunit type 1 TsaB n=1 Tax=Brevibacillus sp. SYP-B805 TaxID=1578199 RepID=UPI0013EC2FA1|nr:tRNA (adenosine(37)-N6)-threonylcarbamoyltransferase complex dimerization subunit type 1 TsaB [Brevibacillus sp. SYP-B805]NGQ96061.1 tRNA (adenosine(37)-N6)-threonylcarbamoyltransferase complex dimerization subunit type 1 TsaB [Brevibacillus sp. SYP-B805]
MRVLAIDTSNLVLSVAVVEEARVLGEMMTNLQKNHSVRLMDSISGLMDELNLLPDELAGIAVAQGPGSYTGVRIGVATAKSMAWALGIPVVGVSSLQAVAMNAAGFSGGIVPMFDARRGQVYTGGYRTQEDGSVALALPERIVLLREWLDALSEEWGDSPMMFLGDDVAMHRDLIAQRMGRRAVFAPAAFNHPRAAHIGWLGIRRLAEAGSPHDMVPEYLQVAEAEAKWLAKQNG